MIKWTDIGLLLSNKRLGENKFISSIFTKEHGKTLAITYGKKPQFEPFSLVQTHFTAKTENQLGTFKLESLTPFSLFFLEDQKRLQVLLMSCFLMDRLLPQGETFSLFFEKTIDFASHLEEKDWLKFYILWEIDLLSNLGFGLNLSCCALGGDVDTLCFVSPKTGCAVSFEKGKPWAEKLLPLPSFFSHPEEDASKEDLLAGLALTAYFLQREALNNTSIPFDRKSLV